MKIPLKYQTSDYDCVPTTFLNGLNYLLERDKIDPILIKTIINYSMDILDKDGVSGKGGTSKLAIQLLAKWLDDYSDLNGLGINIEYLSREDMDLDKSSRVENSISKGGVFLPCVCLNDSVYHYVLVTKLDKDYVYFFDPYSIEAEFDTDEIQLIKDKPFSMNRKVARRRFNSDENSYYSMGLKDKREGVLMVKINKS